MKIIKYLLYYIVFYIVILVYSLCEQQYKVPYNIYVALYPILIGAYLAVPYLTDVLKKDGTWYINYIKIITFCLPSLYVSLLPYIYGHPQIARFVPYNHHLMYFFFHNTQVPHTAIGILLGYTFIASFYKK